MKSVCCFILIMLLSGTSMNAQSAEDSVKLTVSTMFNAMQNADSNALKSVFAEGVILQTIAKAKTGELVVRTQKIENFIQSIGSLTKNDADEQIVFETVKIDGALAIAWTPYKFYFKGNFSHCGVNMFQLVRLTEGWKINFLIDTRRKEGCN
jgi:hypothetical protein